ncbi:MAG: hypothetical protein AB7P12_14305 [Alphaproteobacteria bacterium]
MAAADLNTDVETLKHDLRALRDDLKSLRGSLSDELRDGADRAAEGAAGAARSAMASVSAAGEKGYNVAARQIEANPLTSVLVAAGMGFVVGSLIRR